MSFYEFFKIASASPQIALSALLTLGVIFVNGWTDAPNAIASCVCTETLSMKRAVFISAAANMLGTLSALKINCSVTQNVFDCAKLSGTPYGHAALNAALISVIFTAVLAWIFGIPTSESHAVISALIGAAVACKAEVNTHIIFLMLFGLVISVVGGFTAGYFIYGYLKRINLSSVHLKRLQIASAVFMSLMHGAQDGQKFIGIFIAAVSMCRLESAFSLPTWVTVLCSMTMALGTALGGGRIIKTVGRKMVSLELKSGVSSDIAGGIGLMLSTLLGLPVSTTHAKTAAVMGSGFVSTGLDIKTALEMVTAWIVTFPLCFISGYLITRFTV